MSCAMIVVFAVAMSALLTNMILRGYGVTIHNHALFTCLFRMKARNATSDEYAEAVMRWLSNEIDCGKPEGVYALDVLELLDDSQVDKVLGIVVCRLLDNGYKPVMVDRANGICIRIGHAFME